MKYLGVQKGAEDGDGGTDSVDRPDLSVEDDDGRDDHGDTLHGVADAEGERRNLVQGHVRDLVVQVVKYTLCHHPPASNITETYQQVYSRICKKKESLRLKNTHDVIVNLIDSLYSHRKFKVTQIRLELVVN